jgi:hypothetical protein
MMPTRTLYLLIGVLLSAAVPAAAGAAGAPGRVSLSYHLWEGGLHAFSFETLLDRRDSTYSVKLSAHTEGLVKLLYPYKLKARTDGIADEDGLRPKRYRSTSKKRGKKRRQDITYLSDGSLEVRVEPEKHAKRLREIPEWLRSGTLDPATAVFSIIEAFTRAGRCEGSIPVYDGRRRYDLVVTEVGARTLKPNSYGIYSGRATICQVEVEPLAGFKKKKRRSDRAVPSTIKVWMAPVAQGDLAVPVRLEGKTKMGRMVLHLVDAEQQHQVERAAR